MSIFYRSILVCALSLGTAFGTVSAQSSSLEFSNSWIRGSAPGQKHGAGYLTIRNTADTPVELTKAHSDRAARVELHTVLREDGVAKMREVPVIVVPANGQTTLEPGGYHLMFIDLTEPFTPGETIPLALQFGTEPPVTVEFVVQPPTHRPQSDHSHHKH